MTLTITAQWLAFSILAFIAVAGALGMATTMSMFRSGIFLMASFVGVAGLFVLQGADLLGLLQVMMYVGGMLVMILFMVLFSHDPGGTMMTSGMELPWIERLFSRGLDRTRSSDHGAASDHGGHEMMSMFTPAKRFTALLGLVTGSCLIAFIAATRPWEVVSTVPDPDSARRVGHLLMGKYMTAFEGAGLLILLGIFAAVYLQHPASHPSKRDREHLRAAMDEEPPPVAPDSIRPSATTAEGERPS